MPLGPNQISNLPSFSQTSTRCSSGNCVTMSMQEYVRVPLAIVNSALTGSLPSVCFLINLVTRCLIEGMNVKKFKAAPIAAPNRPPSMITFTGCSHNRNATTKPSGTAPRIVEITRFFAIGLVRKYWRRAGADMSFRSARYEIVICNLSANVKLSHSKRVNANDW